MYDFITLFQFITKSRAKNIDYIFNTFSRKKLEALLDIYLVINGFRKACLTYLSLFPKISIIDLEKQYKVRIYHIQSEFTNVYLFTNDVSKKIEKIARGYEKYTYGKNIVSKQSKYYQQQVGKVLGYYTTPLDRTTRIIGYIVLKISYGNKFITRDIFNQTLYDFPDCKRLKPDVIKLNKLLKKVSDKFNFEFIIGYD